MIEYAWLIPVFPAMGALINAFFGKRYLRDQSHMVAVTAVGASLFISLLVFVAMVLKPASYELKFFEWIISGSLKTHIGFLLDPLTSIMLLVVTGVGLLIHIYSAGYMHGDEGYHRFFAYLNLFMFFMLILVMAGNYLLMFVGWEGVGLCSYLLIGFWYQKKSASDAGKKAFIVNRIGDAGFMFGIFLIFASFGSLDYSIVFANTHLIDEKIATIITLCLFVGAMGKSAQIPLYVWLPDAMEGPTPVSALIHAATMVTAGVYMVVRSNALFSMAPISMEVVGIVGAFTAIFAASIGLVQNDIKKVLAYSTVSQLGYMFLGLGVGAYVASIFHLMTHAFFKGLLFLGAGSVIHALGGEQDIRKMGGLSKHLPITYPTFLIATIAIAGIPPFAGFFSKDEILGEAFKGGHYLLWTVGVVGAFMTSFYMFRLVYMTFYGESRVDHEVAHHIHESPKNMTVPLMTLALLSTIGGIIPGFPPESGWIHSFLSAVFRGHEEGIAEVHHGLTTLDYSLMSISVGVGIGGFLLARYMYGKRMDLPGILANRFSSIYQLLLNKYWVDEVYESFVVNPSKRISKLFWDFDMKVIDGTVNGVVDSAYRLGNLSTLFENYGIYGVINIVAYANHLGSRVLRRMQTGFVNNYALIMIIGVSIITAIGLYLKLAGLIDINLLALR